MISRRRTQQQQPTNAAAVVLVLDRRGAPLPLRDQPAYAARMAEIAEAEAVKARARRRDERARARQLSPRPSRSAVEMMRDLAAGGVIPAAPPANERQAAAEELGIARAAELALHGELDEIARELSFQISQRLVAQNRAAMVGLYEHLLEAAAALGELQRLRAEMLAAGYQPSEVVLPTFIPPAIYLIGAADNVNSQLSQLRRWLAEQGMI